jgi:hypothetical protein
MTKYCIDGLTDIMRRELKVYGIRVVLLVPAALKVRFIVDYNVLLVLKLLLE